MGVVWKCCLCLNSVRAYSLSRHLGWCSKATGSGSVAKDSFLYVVSPQSLLIRK